MDRKPYGQAFDVGDWIKQQRIHADRIQERGSNPLNNGGNNVESAEQEVEYEEEAMQNITVDPDDMLRDLSISHDGYAPYPTELQLGMPEIKDVEKGYDAYSDGGYDADEGSEGSVTTTVKGWDGGRSEFGGGDWISPHTNRGIELTVDDIPARVIDERAINIETALAGGVSPKSIEPEGSDEKEKFHPATILHVPQSIGGVRSELTGPPLILLAEKSDDERTKRLSAKPCDSCGNTRRGARVSVSLDDDGSATFCKLPLTGTMSWTAVTDHFALPQDTPSSSGNAFPNVVEQSSGDHVTSEADFTGDQDGESCFSVPMSRENSMDSALSANSSATGMSIHVAESGRGVQGNENVICAVKRHMESDALQALRSQYDTMTGRPDTREYNICWTCSARGAQSLKLPRTKDPLGDEGEICLEEVQFSWADVANSTACAVTACNRPCRSQIGETVSDAQTLCDSHLAMPSLPDHMIADPLQPMISAALASRDPTRHPDWNKIKSRLCHAPSGYFMTIADPDEGAEKEDEKDFELCLTFSCLREKPVGSPSCLQCTVFQREITDAALSKDWRSASKSVRKRWGCKATLNEDEIDTLAGETIGQKCGLPSATGYSRMNFCPGHLLAYVGNGGCGSCGRSMERSFQIRESVTPSPVVTGTRCLSCFERSACYGWQPELLGLTEEDRFRTSLAFLLYQSRNVMAGDID